MLPAQNQLQQQQQLPIADDNAEWGTCPYNGQQIEIKCIGRIKITRNMFAIH